MSDENTVAKLIAEECKALSDMLIEKNRKYGNSAIEPMRIASRASPEEQLLVRIDDKLSRLKSAQPDETEDVWKDLLGYGILLQVCRRLKNHAAHPLVGRRVKNGHGVRGTVKAVEGGAVAVCWDGGPDGTFSSLDAFQKACVFDNGPAHDPNKLIGRRVEARDGSIKAGVIRRYEGFLPIGAADDGLGGHRYTVVWENDRSETLMSLQTLQRDYVGAEP